MSAKPVEISEYGVFSEIQALEIGHKSTMAQMAHFSFPYYFTIPNYEFRISKFALRISEFGIVKYM